MKQVRNKRLLCRAIAAAFPDDTAAAMKHIQNLSRLNLDELMTLMDSEVGMRTLQGPLVDMQNHPLQIPRFDELVAAKPGRMTRLELARVLSGGTRSEWGPARRRKQS